MAFNVVVAHADQDEELHASGDVPVSFAPKGSSRSGTRRLGRDVRGSGVLAGGPTGVLSVRAVVGNLRDRRRLKAVFDDAHVGLRPSVQGKPVVENRQLTIGDDFTLWADAATTRLEGPGRLVIGDRVFINSGARLIAKNYIEIGDDVAIGFDALIVDSHMHGVAGEPVRHETTIIGAGSWIGARAIVLAGVTIGRRCIVGAGAVVARSVPDDTLVVGNPAIPVKTITYPPGCRKAWNNVWNAAYWDDGGYRPVPGA